MKTHEVKEISDNLNYFQKTGDINNMLNIIHDDFFYVDSSGRQFDKETYIDQFVDPESIRWLVQDIITFDELVQDDLAVVQLLIEEKFHIAGKVYEGRFRGLHIYSKENCTWRWRGGQTTMIHEG